MPDYDYDFEDFLKFCEEEHPNIPRLIQRYGNPYEVESNLLLMQSRRKSRSRSKRK